MKYTVVLSVVLVGTSLGGFGCGADSGNANTVKNSNNPAIAVTPNAGNTSSATSNNSARKDVETDSVSPGGPAATVKLFHDLAGKGDADGMTKLFSEKTTRERTRAQIKENNASFSKVAQEVIKVAPTATIYRVTETVDNDTAVVKFTYGNPAPAARGGRRNICRLVKEKGDWKIVTIEEDRDY